MIIRLRPDGINGTIKELTKLKEQAFDQVGRALYFEAERTMSDAKENYVPVRTGTLRSSGRVIGPLRGQKGWTCELGFGSVAGWYAVIVHERIPVHPQRWGRTASGRRGQNKSLEKPVRETAKTLEQRLSLWFDYFQHSSRVPDQAPTPYHARGGAS